MPVHRTIPRLMLVTDARRARRPLLEVITQAVAGGVDAVYLRGDPLTGDALHVAGVAPTGVAVHESIKGSIGDAIVLVSGPLEAARKLGTGWHLRERDPLPSFDEARRVLGPTSLIGRSVHSPEAARASIGADYLLAGHVYPSASKPGKPPLGLEGLRSIVAAAPCPVLAIGGITAERVGDVIGAGAHGIAVIGAIAGANDPRAAASALRTALDCAIRSARQRNQLEELPVSDADTTNPPNGQPQATLEILEIVVNGKTVTVPAGQTVHDFLAQRRLADTMAIVERNGEIVPRAQYGATALAAGDRLEVVHAVGGG